MTAEGFHHNPYESSDQDPDESKDKPKSKKKNAAESMQAAVADRGKDLWGKLLGERKDEQAPHAENDEVTVDEPDKADSAAEQAESEDDPALEVLTADEEAAVTRMYAEARLDELDAGRSEAEDPADAAAREANIELLHDLLAESQVAELENEETGADKPARVPWRELPGAKPFEPGEAVELNAPAPRPVETGTTEGTLPAEPRGHEAVPALDTPQPHVEALPSHQRDPKMGYLLLGGAVGYLIGRRRGRIKTEKRMNAVKKKLENQVEAVQQKVMRQEAAVQRLARQNHELRQEAKPRQEVPVPPERREAQPVRREAPRAAAPRFETAPRAEGLSREQLLEASSQVRFGETNLRRVYDAQLVDEAGLRRLMHEAEAGHDLRRALAREFLVKELRFERDPRLKGGTPDSGGATGGGTAFTDVRTAQPPVQAAAPSPASAAPASAPPTQASAPRKSRQTDVSPAALIALTIFTLALAVYAIWLTVTR